MSDDRATEFVRFLDEFAKLRGRLQSAFDPAREGAGLTDLDMVVLNAVCGAATPPTVPQIGRSLGHARQVIQRAATGLSVRGLIATVANPDHKRAHRLLPTADGLALKAEADRRGLARADLLTDGLDAGAIVLAADALRRIRDSLERNLRRLGDG